MLKTRKFGLIALLSCVSAITVILCVLFGTRAIDPLGLAIAGTSLMLLGSIAAAVILFRTQENAELPEKGTRRYALNQVVKYGQVFALLALLTIDMWHVKQGPFLPRLIAGFWLIAFIGITLRPLRKP